MPYINSKIKKFLISVVLLFSVVTCKNDNIEVIPIVHFTIVLSSTDVLAFGTGSTIIRNDGGVKGLIIYRASETDFFAFDKLCTNYPLDTAAVVLNTTTMKATCPKCKSEFQINLYGSVNKGPAKHDLQQYQTSFDGVRLQIWN